MKFTEETLELAVIKLLAEVDIPHCNGAFINKQPDEVLLRDDLKQYLLNQYSKDDITLNEINTIIRQLEFQPSSALYHSNKAVMQMVANGFPLKREDRNKKDLYINLIDYSSIANAQAFQQQSQLNIAADPIAAYQKKIKTFIVL